MFAARYFGALYWNAYYWAATGATTPPTCRTSFIVVDLAPTFSLSDVGTTLVASDLAPTFSLSVEDS
jgi:hypothetical protein